MGTLQRMRIHLGFDDLTNKLMRVVQHPVSRVLFWAAVVLIYEVMEHGARMRRLRVHVS
jgi:hypothetical protein